MSFNSILFTNRGKTLQAKALGGTPLKFTKIGMGSGNLGGQSQLTLTNLIETKVTINISEIIKESNYANIKGYFNNADINIGFYWREVGLFAIDPDLGEILYCYGNAGALAEYIPPQTSEIIEKYISIPAIVGDATNVTATLDSSIYATKDEVSLKWEVVISQNVPEINQRKENTLYFKVTDTLNQGVSNNIVVSPTMGLKIEN